MNDSKELKIYECDNFRVFELPIISPHKRFGIIPKIVFENQESFNRIIGTGMNLNDKLVAYQKFDPNTGKLNDLDKIIADKKEFLLKEKL